MTQGLYDRPQAAKFLSISLSQLDRLIRAGELPTVRVAGRLVRLAVADLEQFIARRRQAPAAA